MALKIVKPNARIVLPVIGYVVGIDVGCSKQDHSSSIYILEWSYQNIEIEFPRCLIPGLMVQSSRMAGRRLYGLGSTRQRHNDSGGSSINTA